MSGNDFVVIFRPQDEWRGDLMVQYLRDNGVTSQLGNRASVGLWGNGSMSLANLEILVPADQADRAGELLDAYLAADDS